MSECYEALKASAIVNCKAALRILKLEDEIKALRYCKTCGAEPVEPSPVDEMSDALREIAQMPRDRRASAEMAEKMATIARFVLRGEPIPRFLRSPALTATPEPEPETSAGERDEALKRTSAGTPIAGWDLRSLTQHREQAEVAIRELEAENERLRAEPEPDARYVVVTEGGDVFRKVYPLSVARAALEEAVEFGGYERDALRILPVGRAVSEEGGA